MNADDERTRSLWSEVALPRAAALKEDARTDVLVVGAGIAGLSTAYELALEGRRVLVADRGALGGGMTARTSAHLSYEIDDFYHALIGKHGARKARLYYESQKAAVDRIEAICREEKIACQFARVDLFYVAFDRDGRDSLAKELEACATIGFDGVGWAEAPVAQKAKGALRFPNQARFHPELYLAGLVRAIKRRGGVLHADTNIESVEENTRGITARTGDGVTVRARAAVIATNSPTVTRLAVHTKQAPYRSYVIAMELPASAGLDCLIWDTADPYHYVRRAEDGDGKPLLIVGGEDHKSGEKDDGAERFGRLEAWTRLQFPKVGKVRYRWSGQVYEPSDYVPFLGLCPGKKRIHLVTGDSGEGLTTGVVASRIIPDLIAGRANPWAGVYRPNRKVTTPSAVVSFVKDLAGAAKHLAAHVFSAETTPEKIARNEGAVISVDGKKVAAFRDERGTLHLHSASCTHMGCVVRWNGTERCWDCPCHGSHFAPTGAVLQGPATAPLEPVDAGEGED